MDATYKKLAQFADVECNVSLASLTTLRIGGTTKYVAYPQTEVAFDGLMKTIHHFQIPYKVFGKGSNILCSDQDYPGVIVRLDRALNNSYFTDTEIVAQAGCSIIALSHEAMKHGLSGLEFANGIPATVGGVTYMNAGAYKSSMSEIIQSVYVYKDEKFEWLDAKDCAFAYRSSIFHQHPDWIIVAVKMQLTRKDPEEINELMINRRERRLASQPLDFPSAGSVFRNPENHPAWQLIEGIGYRGKSIGGAKVSEKHSNFIVNANHASAKDFYQLIQEIQAKVKEQYSIDLHMEVEKFNWQ